MHTYSAKGKPLYARHTPLENKNKHTRIHSPLPSHTFLVETFFLRPHKQTKYTQIPSHLLLALLIQNAELLGFEPQVKSASKNDRAEDAYHDEHLS
jgi:hypothetical protein